MLTGRHLAGVLCAVLILYYISTPHGLQAARIKAELSAIQSDFAQPRYAQGHGRIPTQSAQSLPKGWVPAKHPGYGHIHPGGEDKKTRGIEFGVPVKIDVDLNDAAAIESLCTTASSARAPYCFFEAPGLVYKSRLGNLFYDDTVNAGGWQEEVYDYARAVADTAGSRVIADIGCGSAWKLVQNFGDLTTLGFDLEPTLSFLRKAYPTRAWLESRLDDAFWPPQVDLVVAADVIEHIPNPDEFMRTLRRFCSQYYVISTPDRSANSGKHNGHHLVQGGPPENGAHVREWTHNELAVYATHSGFKVIEVRRRRSNKIPIQNTMWMLLELQSTDDCRQGKVNE